MAEIRTQNSEVDLVIGAHTHRVPLKVKQKYDARWRGETYGDKAMLVLAFFTERPVLVPRSDGSFEVHTRLTLKADPSWSRVYEAKINTSKMQGEIAKCAKIEDDDKYTLFQQCNSATALKFVREYDARRAAVTSTEPVQRQEAVAEAAKTEAAKRDDERQKSLKDFGIQSVSKAQAEAISWYIAAFFILCVATSAKIDASAAAPRRRRGGTAAAPRSATSRRSSRSTRRTTGRSAR